MKTYEVKVYADGHQEWRLDGKLHCEHGPAIVYDNGTKSWWINNKRHNEHGPAVVTADGHQEWYINGEQLTKEEFDNRTNTCDAVVEVNGKRYRLVEE